MTSDQPMRKRRTKLDPSKRKLYKNVTLEADVVVSFTGVIDHLEKKFGFRPTQAQTMTYLIRMFRVSEGLPVIEEVPHDEVE